MIDLGGTTIIVTGFPRSGTSMMMRMLMFGGIGIRAAEKPKDITRVIDPYGTLELTDVGPEIKSHPVEWTANHAVKLVSPYIKWLPIDRPLKAIFMCRDQAGIIASLMAMKTIWEMDIQQTNEYALGYLDYNKVPVLKLRYEEVMQYPKSSAMRICDFLEVEMDIDEMAKAVDKNLKKKYVEAVKEGRVEQWKTGIIYMTAEEFRNAEPRTIASPADLMEDANAATESVSGDPTDS